MSTARACGRSSATTSPATRTRPGSFQVDLPAWSPDGGRIAFALADVQGGVPLAVYVMADGTELRGLTGKNEPSWAPDGSRLVLVDYTGGVGIALADPRGLQPDVRYLDPAGGRGVSKPVFSPDGRSIAFAAVRAGETAAMWVMPAMGGSAQVLIRDAAQPAWSPDGSRIAFLRR